jgi:hypothetical protein
LALEYSGPVQGRAFLTILVRERFIVPGYCGPGNRVSR